MVNNDNYGAEPPSKKETEEEYREHLSKHGCEICDEDDPDNLQEVTLVLPPIGQYSPTHAYAIACDKHTEQVKSKNQCCLNPSYTDPETVTEDGYTFEKVTCQNCGETFKEP